LATLGIYIEELHELPKTKYKINRGEEERILKIGKLIIYTTKFAIFCSGIGLILSLLS